MRDNTGAVLPGTTVTIEDVDTNTVRTVTTDNQGLYASSSLQIGNYRVSAEKQGFAKQTQQGLVLTIGQVLSVNLKLQVGSVSQQVTVTAAEAAQVNTATSEVGGLVNSSQMTDLPLNGRDVLSLEALNTQVAPSQAAPSGGANFGNSPRYSVAGARIQSGSFLLDGVEIRDFWGSQAGLAITGTSLGVASIAEFTMITNGANAEYHEPSVMSEVTRSGTNRFHGSAYGYFRNSAMDARNFFNPISGPPAFHRNQFGGAVGGPIQKDKTFFFVNYEGIRASESLQNSQVVPDANAHNGMLPCAAAPNFPCVNGLANVGVATAVGPYLALYPNYGVTGGPPLPPGYADNSNLGTASFTTNVSQPQTENYIAAKVDHQFGASNTLSVRMVSDRGLQTDPWLGGTGNAASPGDIEYPNLETDPEDNWYGTIQDRQIISPNLVNIATVAYVRTYQGQLVNASGLPSILLDFNTLHEPGQITISGVATIAAPTYEPLQQIQNSFTEQDEVDWVHGAHTFAFGAGVSRIQCNCIQNSSAGGVWAFGSLTGFLQNAPITYNGQFSPTGASAYSAGIRYGRQTNIAFFVEDNWRATKRLTLNLGIRDDYITNPTEAKGNFYDVVGLTPQNASTCSNNPACDNGTPQPGAPTGFTHVPHPFQKNPSTRNIDPRVGLAWDIFGNGKTAFRAAYGIYHDIIYPYFYVVGSGFLYPNGTTSLSAPGNVLTFPTVSPSSVLPTSRSKPWNSLASTPYMQEWNATVQEQLPMHMLLSVGYIGSTGRKLTNNAQFNSALPSANLVDGVQFRPFSPAAASAFPVCKTTSSSYSASACAAASNGYGVGGAGMLPNANFTVLDQMIPNGSSSYHSGLVSVQRNFGAIQFSSAFTWARCLDYGSTFTGGPSPGNDSVLYVFPSLPRKYNYGPCAYNTSKNWVSNALIPLPFPGNNRLVKGWELSIIASARTGNPITPQVSPDQENLIQMHQGNEVPDVNPNFTGSRYLKQKHYSSPTYDSWFDPNAYVIQPPGEIGNVPRMSLYGPNYFDLDTSIMKNTRMTKFLGEAGSLQIRGDFFNATNHTNFGLPNTTIFNGSPGNTVRNPLAGQISTIVGTSRQLQFSATLNF